MFGVGTSSSGRRALPPTVRGTEVTDPVNSIDSLLQDTFLFVMDVLHNTSLQCDYDFYRRACKLIETLKQQLKTQHSGDEFIHYMLYAVWLARPNRHQQCFAAGQPCLVICPT